MTTQWECRGGISNSQTAVSTQEICRSSRGFLVVWRGCIGMEHFTLMSKGGRRSREEEVVRLGEQNLHPR